jgi:hypothetical protein
MLSVMLLGMLDVMDRCDGFGCAVAMIAVHDP